MFLLNQFFYLNMNLYHPDLSTQNYILIIYYEKNSHNNFYLFDNDYVWVAPIKITSSIKSEMVYNFEVKEDNSYIVENTIVHNCQPFSKSGDRKGFTDTRGTLFFNICEIAKYHKPKYMILENVKNIVGHDKGNTWKVIKKAIIDLGYQTHDKPIIINSLMFEIPQNRERAIILCCRNDTYQYPFPDVPRVIKKTLKCSLTDVMKVSEDNSLYKITGKIKATETIWNSFLKILCDNKVKILQCPIWTDWWDSDGKNTPNNGSKTFYTKYKKWIDLNKIIKIY